MDFVTDHNGRQQRYGDSDTHAWPGRQLRHAIRSGGRGADAAGPRRPGPTRTPRHRVESQLRRLRRATAASARRRLGRAAPRRGGRPTGGPLRAHAGHRPADRAPGRAAVGENRLAERGGAGHCRLDRTAAVDVDAGEDDIDLVLDAGGAGGPRTVGGERPGGADDHGGARPGRRPRGWPRPAPAGRIAPGLGPHARAGRPQRTRGGRHGHGAQP